MTLMVGLDVSKHWLDGYCSDNGRRLRVENDAAGIGELAGELVGDTACLVVMEASGGYEASAHRALVAKGVPTAIVNPKRVRDFAKASGVAANTDRIDAEVIAGYGLFQKPAAIPAPHPVRVELGEILACRRQCAGEIQVRRQQLEHVHSAAIRGRMLEVIAFLEQEMAALDQLRQERIAADPDLLADCRLLLTMPGCGPVLAATLLADMPELGRLDRRSIASLAGLAPIARDSGLRQNRRVIGGGRSLLRRTLYMAAVASLKAKDRTFARRYAELVGRGKPPKVAIVALMRKMIITLNAMLITRTPWRKSSTA